VRSSTLSVSLEVIPSVAIAIIDDLVGRNFLIILLCWKLQRTSIIIMQNPQHPNPYGTAGSVMPQPQQQQPPHPQQQQIQQMLAQQQHQQQQQQQQQQQHRQQQQQYLAQQQSQPPPPPQSIPMTQPPPMVQPSAPPQSQAPPPPPVSATSNTTIKADPQMQQLPIRAYLDQTVVPILLDGTYFILTNEIRPQAQVIH
jgi:hypothetical protein